MARMEIGKMINENRISDYFDIILVEKGRFPNKDDVEDLVGEGYDRLRVERYYNWWMAKIKPAIIVYELLSFLTRISSEECRKPNQDEVIEFALRNGYELEFVIKEWAKWLRTTSRVNRVMM